MVATTNSPPQCSLPAEEACPELANSTVVFVLGGPGVGKGTQCGLLAKQYGFVHLSAGDLLRAERAREGSRFGALIEWYIREGQIVPYEVTIGLLRDAMLGHVTQSNQQPRFLIDGFPRKPDQAEAFERLVCPCTCVLSFTCADDNVMVNRILRRAQVSGGAARVDDNAETILKRLATFREQTMPVIEMYRTLGKLREVACEPLPEVVFNDVCHAIRPHLQLRKASASISAES